MLNAENKVCTKCGTAQDRSLFSARQKSRDGLASWCRNCFQINWKQRYYEKHEHYRNSHNLSRNRIRNENARKVFDFLSNHPCKCCGENDPVVLEFDHRIENDKIENI